MAIGEKSVWVYQIVSSTAVVIVFVGHVMIHEDGVGGSGGSVVVVVVILVVVVVVVVVDVARRVRRNGREQLVERKGEKGEIRAHMAHRFLELVARDCLRDVGVKLIRRPLGFFPIVLDYIQQFADFNVAKLSFLLQNRELAFELAVEA